ncbi:O-acyltransferase like protein-like [Aricia agestis]|uniref:O-acyltransferase like protein-like n=1 Tax=Aricia agestis TaxID=91739 RepID=UPI001C20B7BF|nr:O-acyltransferase like protein-like [Aricia agestis]
MLRAAVLLACAAAAVAWRVADDSPYPLHRLPTLYELDHYDRCLREPQGLYCSGRFQLTSEKPSPTFNLIKKISGDTSMFNRSFVHRGVCVSERCPSTEVNSTWRFEQCVQKQLDKYRLQGRLESYHCYTNTPERPPDAPERMFVGALLLILFFNFLGTTYDLITYGEGKSKLLRAWSVRANWARFTATYEDGDKRLLNLKPIQGIRCTMILFVVLAHTVTIDHYLYSGNPIFFEKILHNPLTIILRNGSSMIQLFIVLSNFLYGYGTLIYAKQHKLRLRDLPLRILNRVVRLSPVHLGVVAYAATWWKRAGDGPQWDSTVGAESDICRSKFWLHAFYLHNLFDSNNHCLLQTWYMAADMQLFVVATLVLIVLEQRRWRPIPVLLALTVGSILLNMALAYYFDWKVLLYITSPENIRSLFTKVESFSAYYIKPWGSLPACFMGLLLAHIHNYVQETDYPITKHRFLTFVYHLMAPLCLGWICLGNLLVEYKSPLFTAIYLGLERPVFAFLACIFILYACNNVDSYFRRVMSWRGWQVSGRLMLSVVCLHWCINMSGVAGRRTLTDFSVFSVAGEALSTLWWSYWLAIPMTLLLEYPFLKTFAAFFS